MSFRLSASLLAHTGEVKAVAAPSNDLVLSASRDASAIVWSRTSSTTFAPLVTFTCDEGAVKYVNAVALLPQTADRPQAIVTAHQDTLIRVWAIEPTLTEPTHILPGHSNAVCALNTTTDGTIISGSWDFTAKVWQNFQEQYTLKGHSNSVLTVLALDSGQSLTGSADNKIKLWKQHHCVRTYAGHSAPVRGLTLLTDIGFASCSNDGNILLWTHEGDIISKFSGHTDFVYCIATLPSGDIVSSSEDRTVRVWRDGELHQTITHPAVSIWSVSVLPNGDIVSGASDSVVRIFSESDERVASADDIKAFEDSVASQAVPSETLDDVPTSDPSSLSQPGKPGDTKIVKNGSVLEAYQWDSSKLEWQKVGVVTGQPGSTKKTTFEGKQYDYVFDVDIQDGVPPLKLPYNVTENPFVSAQQFLERHQLPLSYLDQVVAFINKNASAAQLGGGNEYQDPYTGTTRYRPAENAPASGSTFQDPFTGASRYQPSIANASNRPAVPSSGDPFTGAVSYTPDGKQSPAPTAFVNPTTQASFPFRDTATYRGTSNPNGLRDRLRSVNNALHDEPSTSGLAMHPQDLANVDQVVSHASSRPPAPPLGPAHVETVTQLLERWPRDSILPVSDLARLIAGAQPEMTISSSHAQAFITAIINAAGLPQLFERPRDVITLLALRTFANVAHVANGAWVVRLFEVLEQVPYRRLSAPQRVAFGSILSNYSVSRLTIDPDLPAEEIHLRLIREVLQSETDDVEVQYRAIIALGNVLHVLHARGGSAVDMTPMHGPVASAVERIPKGRFDRRAMGELVLKMLASV